MSLTDAEQKIEAWITLYNQVKPQSALGWSYAGWLRPKTRGWQAPDILDA